MHVETLHKALIADWGNLGNWQGRHMQAVRNPTPQEKPIVKMILNWLEYADQHKAQYESKIGDDGVLGINWSRIGSELLGLLNGNLGRLDGGTLDGVIRNALKTEGFDPDTM